MISTLIARLAMVASIAYYSLTLALVWFSGLFGRSDIVSDAFDIPANSPPAPVWVLLFGIFVSVITIFSLGKAYWSIEKMLSGGAEQDFNILARRLKRAGIGLMLFWLGYNVMAGAMPFLFTLELSDGPQFSDDWDILDVGIIILIVGIALYAISHALHRASAIEEENKQFL